MSQSGIAVCPHCNRGIRTQDYHFMLHNTCSYVPVCPLSNQRVPIEGDDPSAYACRAKLVANLASQVQDADPKVVWAYLTALSGNELQRLTMIALAAIPTDQTVAEMFAWVTDLPAAKGVGA